MSRQEIANANFQDFMKGLLGSAAATGGALFSLQDIEAWLRIGSLGVGIAVGLVTIWSIVRRR